MSKKLTILIDMDSITCDLMEAWLGKYNEDYNDNVTIDDIKSWDTHKYVKKECGRRMYRYLTSDLYTRLKPLPGAIDAITYLRKKHHVVWVTAAPSGSADAKVQWIKDHFPGAKKNDVCICDQKHLVKGDIFIDDSPSNIRNYKKAWPGAKAMTIAYPYNEEVAHLTDVRAGSWKDTEAAWKAFVTSIDNLAIQVDMGYPS